MNDLIVQLVLLVLFLAVSNVGIIAISTIRAKGMWCRWRGHSWERQASLVPEHLARAKVFTCRRCPASRYERKQDAELLSDLLTAARDQTSNVLITNAHLPWDLSKRGEA